MRKSLILHEMKLVSTADDITLLHTSIYQSAQKFSMCANKMAKLWALYAKYS